MVNVRLQLAQLSITSEKGKEVIAKGWKKAEITGVIDGTITLPTEDPFESVID